MKPTKAIIRYGSKEYKMTLSEFPVSPTVEEIKRAFEFHNIYGDVYKTERKTFLELNFAPAIVYHTKDWSAYVEYELQNI